MSIVITILILAAGLVPVVLWARWRWKKLKPDLFSEAELKADGPEQQNAGTATAPPSLEAVTRLLTRAESILEGENLPETTIAAEAIHRLACAASQIAPAIGAVIQESLEKAELTSLLLGDDGLYSYIVVVPNRHDHAHLIGRYVPFSAGWRLHATSLRESLKSSGAFRGLTALLFFLSADRKECIARIAWAGPDCILIPSALAQSGDLSVTGVKVLDSSFEFSLAA